MGKNKAETPDVNLGGRPIKSGSRAKPICITVPEDVLRYVDRLRGEAGQARAEFFLDLIVKAHPEVAEMIAAS